MVRAAGVDCAPSGPEGAITQTSNPMPPYTSANHMGVCGMVNVFVGNFGNLPAGLDPNSAQFLPPAYTYLSPIDDRNASNDVLNNTPCISPNAESRCVGNILQSCQVVMSAISSGPCETATSARPVEILVRCAKIPRDSAARLTLETFVNSEGAAGPRATSKAV